jgi:hypothetical protein
VPRFAPEQRVPADHLRRGVAHFLRLNRLHRHHLPNAPFERIKAAFHRVVDRRIGAVG